MKTKTQLTNRILSIVLALVLMVGILPITSFTASATETEYDGVIGELYYKVDQENNVTTIFGNGALSSTTALVNVMTSNVVIEEGVTSISNYAFRGLVSLEKLTVNGDVTIGNYAFQGCASLETVTFMGNVTSVGNYAFHGCAGLSTIYYYGTAEPRYTNELSYITLYSSNGVSFCGLTPSNPPATEASPLKGEVELIAYEDGVTCYKMHENYLYKVTCTNLDRITNVRFSYSSAFISNPLILYITSNSFVYLYHSNSYKLKLEELPKVPGEVMYGYTDNWVIDPEKPVVTITCVAVGDPIWTWNGTSSATAKFISKDWKATMTVDATLGSAEQVATNCLEKSKVTYTATATANGKTYTNTKTVDGDIGPHNINYLAAFPTVTANCQNPGCSYSSGNSVTLNLQDKYYYTGSPIPDPVTGGFLHGLATYKVTYNGSEDRPSAVGSYNVALNVYDKNGTEKAGIGSSFKIAYLPSPGFNRISGSSYQNNGIYWFADGAVAEVIAPDGYGISKSLNGDYTGSVSLSQSDAKTVHLKRVSDGAMTDAIDLSDRLKWDTTAPEGTVKLPSGNFWTQLVKKNSFRFFFKDAKSITITAQDNDSGVKSIQYFYSFEDLINVSSLNTADAIAKLETAIGDDWEDYNGPFALEQDGKYIVYAKITDNVGSVTYISSDGIVIYSDATSSNANITTTYKAGEDREISVELNGNTVNEVTCDDALLAATDYTVSDGKITLKAEYLDTLAAGEYTVAISVNPMGCSYEDYDINDKPLDLVIILTANPKPVTVPTADTEDYVYDGSEHTYDIPDSEDYTVTGNHHTNAGTYTVTVSLKDKANTVWTDGTTADKTYTFHIEKKAVDLSGVKWDYRAPFRYDGLTHGVAIDESTLPEGASVSNYTGHSGTDTGRRRAAAAITYDANHTGEGTLFLDWEIVNNWTPAEYTVSAPNGNGWLNKDFAITPASGYKISLTNTADGDWKDALTYSGETADGSVTFYLKNETDGTISLAKTVTYKLDKTAPTGKVEFVNRNAWEEFVNTITFGLFFKDEVTVKATANDTLSGVDKIEYASADKAMTLDEVKAITDWTEYNGEFGVTLENAKTFVYFVRITDKAGNVTYLSTDGAEYDTTAPVLYGIENGGVYHGDKVFKATDDNFLKIEVDGVDITNTTEGDNEFKIVADNAEHTVTVTDKAGNVTEYKITVYKKYMVTYSNGDGGSYEKEFKYGEVITIPTNEFFKDTFRKTGHAIKEWHGYTEGMTMPLKDLTFTAVYVPCEYTVTFEENGGEEINPITVTFGEKYGSLPSSAITGLSGGNKNWYLVDADGNVTETNIKNLTIVSTARDHKLFIKRNVLAPSVSVVLTVPGGISDGYQYYIPGASTRVLTATVGNMNTDILEYTYQWYKDGTLIEGANSNVLTLDGNVSDSGTYKVEVTAKLKDGTNIVVNSNTATASKEQKVKILHATNTLSYDANGGEGGPQSSYTGGTSINVSKETPTKEHNNFIGWNTAPDGTGESYQAEDAYIFVNDNGNGGCVVTLYARWKLVEYTITYVADGESVATEKVEHGKDATLTDVPHKDGYVGKWDSDGKNITEDTTISAVYTEVPVVNPDEVKPEDKTDLEDTKAKLEEMLKDDSYTDDDKKDIQDAIDDIDDALKVIGNVEAAIELIDKLPAVDTVKPDDEEAIKAIADAQTAYNALSDYEKSLLDEAAKANLDKLVAALVAYDIVEGDGSSWTEDSDHNITFVVNGLFSKFVGIKVDGKDVDKANYEVKAGSTIITLKASYLDTLAVGEHTITVVYTDGSTDGTFNVHAKANSPATGDNSNMFLWIALLFISGGAVITLTVVDKKKKSLIKK